MKEEKKKEISLVQESCCCWQHVYRITGFLLPIRLQVQFIWCNIHSCLLWVTVGSVKERRTGQRWADTRSPLFTVRREEETRRDQCTCTGRERKITFKTGLSVFLLPLFLSFIYLTRNCRERKREKWERGEERRGERKQLAKCTAHTSRQEKCITVSTPHYNCKKRKHVSELSVKKKKRQVEPDSLKDA